MVFNRDSQSHNRTDVRDRSLDNLYGDATENRNNHRRENQNYEEQKIPNQRQQNRDPPMPNNPFDNSFGGNAFQFSNFGRRAPPSRPSENSQTTGPTRINLSRANTNNQQHIPGGKNLCKIY